MKQAFLILGYGVPKRIRSDLNMQIYLRSIFNTIYQQVIEDGVQPTIVCAGGPTDMFKPYKRTEAGEMVKELERMRRALPRQLQRGWRILPEARSLSTLENLLFSKKKLRDFRQLTIFCEITRTKRIRRFAPKVFGRGAKVVVRGVDFDASPTRYLDPKLIREKEANAQRFDDWALKSAANMRRHHAVYADKVRRLRDARSKDHLKTIRQWFEESIKEFPNIVRAERRA